MWIDDINVDQLVTAYGKLKSIKALGIGVQLNSDLRNDINEVLTNSMDDYLFENLVICDSSKLHVYLMPILCDEYRFVESWSVHIPMDISYDEIKSTIVNYYQESFSEQPYRLNFKEVKILDNKLCIILQSADLETSHTLQALKDFTLNTLGFRIIARKPFEIRIHLGLWKNQTFDEFNLEIEDLIARLTKEYQESLKHISLDGAKLLEHKTLFELREIENCLVS